MRSTFHRVLLRFRREDGFGLVEAMVALGVILASMLVMAWAGTASFTPTAVARERQAATGLADEAMEEIRALPFDTLKKGLDNTDLSTTTDPNIQANCPTSGDYCFLGEEIPRGTNAGVVPLVPHRRTVTVRGIAYTVSTYVTYYQNDSSTNTFRLAAYVSWTSPETHRTSVIQVQTIDNSPAGCLSTATHPFSAPCQPYLYGTVSHGQGEFTVTGSIQGISLDHATLWTTAVAANESLEQVSSVLSDVRSSGVELQLIDDDLQQVGRTTTSAGAENDPSQPQNDYQQATPANESSGSLTASGGNNSIVVTSSGGDSGITTSTTSSTYPSPSHPCADTAGVNQTDGLACANSAMKQGGTSSPAMTAVLTLNSAGSLGTATLASVARAPSSSIAYVNRDTPSGDGLVHAGATRALGTITLGGLPSGVNAPMGWNGYLVRVTNFTDSVAADAGQNAPVPTVSTSGTISYWNGSGYSTMTPSTGAPVSIPVSPVHILYQQGGTGGPWVTVDVVPTLTTGGTGITDPAACQSACTRTQAKARSSSPVLGGITYTVSYAGAGLCDLDLSVDFGEILAKTNYTAAPSG
jgi:type II secretory pathway pseudopilin PulG